MQVEFYQTFRFQFEVLPRLTLMYGDLILNLDDPKIVVDHINGDGLDNRRENLRICTNEKNCRNRRLGENNTSGYKGVSYHKLMGRFGAYVYLDNRKIHIGYFTCPIEAARAYNAAAIKYHGEFAKLNPL